MSTRTKEQTRQRLHDRIRKKIRGSESRPRLAVHRSQVGADSFWFQLPDELWDLAFGTEHYILAASHVPTPPHEDDLFAGLTPLAEGVR